MRKKYDTRLLQCEPATALTLALLQRAKLDAQRGDLAALAWLVSTGAELADVIQSGARHAVLKFARETLAEIDARDVASTWGIG